MALFYMDVLFGLLVIGLLDYFFVYRKERVKAAYGMRTDMRETAQRLLKNPLSYNYDGGVLIIPLPVSIVAILAWQDLGYDKGEHIFALAFMATILVIVAVGRRVTIIASSWMLYISLTFLLLSVNAISNLLYLLFTAFVIATSSFFLSFVLHKNEPS